MHDLIKKAIGFSPVIINRNEPIHPRAAFPQSSDRGLVDVRVEEAPQPVADSTFYGVGRDIAHATPTMWRYQQLAFSEWLSVMGWPFLVAKVPSALVVSMPRGRANPIRPRSNIDNPPQTSLGGLTTLGGVRSSTVSLNKITY